MFVLMCVMGSMFGCGVIGGVNTSSQPQEMVELRFGGYTILNDIHVYRVRWYQNGEEVGRKTGIVGREDIEILYLPSHSQVVYEVYGPENKMDGAVCQIYDVNGELISSNNHLDVVNAIATCTIDI
jgi:hypothetical protein